MWVKGSELSRRSDQCDARPGGCTSLVPRELGRRWKAVQRAKAGERADGLGAGGRGWTSASVPAREKVLGGRGTWSDLGCWLPMRGWLGVK